MILEGKTLYEALGVAKDASQVRLAAAAAAGGCQPPLRSPACCYVAAPAYLVVDGPSSHKVTRDFILAQGSLPPKPLMLGTRCHPQAEIRKAFHRLALALHPDKNPGDASAVEKFQTLQKVYGILSDPDK